MKYRLFVHDMDVHFQRNDADKSCVGEFDSIEASTDYLRKRWWPAALSSVEKVHGLPDWYYFFKTDAGKEP